MPSPKPEQERVDRGRMRTVVVVVVGLAIGVLTSFGQTHLAGALEPLVNSASAWLVAPFVLGALMRTRRGAASAGLTCCLLQLLGYVVTSHLRGFASGGSLIAFWGACAVIGGPLFGAAGHVARRERPSIRGVGASMMAAAFFAEGLWTYLHELHDTEDALVWIGIGLAICLVLLPRLVRVRWLALTLPLGLVGEIALTQFYR